MPLLHPLRLGAAFLRRRHSTLAAAGPIACCLTSRAVIRFRGPDTVKFLHGLLTNDVRTLASNSDEAYVPTPNVPVRFAPPVYSAMLSPQGRFLYDLVLYRPGRAGERLDRRGAGPGAEEDGDGLFADVDRVVLDELLDCFKKYRLRSKVEIDNVTGEFSCWQRFGGNVAVDSSAEETEAASVGWGGAADATGAAASQGNNVGWRWYKDPRLEILGFRGIFPSDTIPPLVESDKEMDEEYYLLWRLERGVAEGSLEITKGEAIPLEYNLVGLNAISFDKGCYVGQEFVARTHHRGVIRKRLVPFKFTDNNGAELDQKVAPGSEVVDTTSSKKVGTVTTALGCLGMGLLRLEDAFKSSTLGIKDQHDVKLKLIRPEWWPAEWTQEFEQRSAVA